MTRVKGKDAAGVEQVADAGVRVDAQLRPMTKFELTTAIAGALDKLMGRAVDVRDKALARAVAMVRKRIAKGTGTKSLLTPTRYERALAREHGLPDNALSFMPDHLKTIIRRDAEHQFRPADPGYAEMTAIFLMFVDREKAVKEIRRVCKAGGTVVEHEFIWRSQPSAEARRIFEGEVCPGIKFDTAEDWTKLYTDNGFESLNAVTGPFVMMSVGGFLADEGFGGTMRLMATAFSRYAYLKKMMWLMPRIMRVRSSLGYVVFSSTKSN